MGVCPSVTKCYEGVEGGLRQRYVTSFFFANTALFTVMSSRPTRISK